MGDPKLLSKFRRFCDTYKAEYAFEGRVEKLDTIDTVDPERLTRGLYVSSEKGTRLVHLDLKRKPPVEICDTVMVVGKDGRHEENRVVPSAILIPAGHYILFPQDLQTRPTRLAFAWNIPIVIALILLIVVYWIMPHVEYAWLFFLAIIILSFWPCIDTYLMDKSKQPKLYTCDEDTWLSLLGEITSEFGVKLTHGSPK